MTTGAKIALGCGIAFLAIAAGTCAVVVGVGWWAKGKVETAVADLSQQQEEVERLQRQADSHHFERPADGVIREDRLEVFLAVRRDVYATYQQHLALFGRLEKQKAPSLSAVAELARVGQDLRLAVARALAEHGMSQDEYRFMVEEIYKSWLTSQMQQSSGGETASEAGAKGMEATAEALRKASQDPEMPEETRRLLEQQEREMGKASEGVREALAPMDTAAANVALFRRHEDEIKKYSMSGLELAGF